MDTSLFLGLLPDQQIQEPTNSSAPSQNMTLTTTTDYMI